MGAQPGVVEKTTEHFVTQIGTRIFEKTEQIEVIINNWEYTIFEINERLEDFIASLQ